MPDPSPSPPSTDPGANLAWAAARYGERTAVVDGERRLSFRELDRRSNRLANALLAHGLGPEDRAAKLMNNRAEIIEINFGVAKAGGASVNLHPRGTAAEHVHIMEDAGAEILFVDADHREQLPAIRAGCTRLRHAVGVGWAEEGVEPYEDWVGRASARAPGVRVGLDGLYYLHYTSGTTGRPKAVVNTHRTHLAWLANFYRNAEFRLGALDAIVHAGPLTHAAFSYAEPTLVRGARNIVLPRFDPGRYLHALERERATLAFLVPAMIHMLLECEELGRADLSSLHTLNYGTAPIALPVLERALEAFGPILRQHFGMTEARQPITVLHPWEHTADEDGGAGRLASCGKAAGGVTLALLDEADRPVRPGEAGELCVRGDYAMAGYWKDPEATAEAMRGGWVHSGDLAVMDGEGYITIIDRKKDMIITGSYNVSPREVEQVLHEHPAVEEAAVFGAPDERWGEIICAAVVARPGPPPRAEEIIAFAASRLAGYKKPRRIEFVEALPKNARGKVLRREIRERHWAGRERKVV